MKVGLEWQDPIGKKLENNNTLKWLQDGVAPQCPIGEIGGNRAYIPDEEPQGFVESHLIKNFEWIFSKRKKGQSGYVTPRK